MADTLTKTDMAFCQDPAPEGFCSLADAFRMYLGRNVGNTPTGYLEPLLEALCAARISAFMFPAGVPIEVPAGYWQFQKRVLLEQGVSIDKSAVGSAMRGGKVIPYTNECDKFERGYMKEADIAAFLAGKAVRGRGSPKKAEWIEFDRRARNLKEKGETLPTGKRQSLAREIFAKIEADGITAPIDAKKGAERLKRIWEAK